MTSPRSTSTAQFRSRALIAIKDIQLQGALDGATGRFHSSHDKALADLPYSEEMRDHLKALRSATLARLAEHLEDFERAAEAAGSFVHWARDAAEATQIVTDLAWSW